MTKVYNYKLTNRKTGMVMTATEVQAGWYRGDRNWSVRKIKPGEVVEETKGGTLGGLNAVIRRTR